MVKSIKRSEIQADAQVKFENALVDVPVKVKNAPVNEVGEDISIEEKVLQFCSESYF